MGATVRMTEYLDIELGTRRWRCHVCKHDLGPAERPYKEGCLVLDRDPREVHPVFSDSEEFNFSFDPEWVRLLEFICPGCATLIETEYLPPGHPLTSDIEIDLDALEARHAAGELDEDGAEGR